MCKLDVDQRVIDAAIELSKTHDDVVIISKNVNMYMLELLDKDTLYQLNDDGSVQEIPFPMETCFRHVGHVASRYMSTLDELIPEFRAAVHIE